MCCRKRSQISLWVYYITEANVSQESFVPKLASVNIISFKAIVMQEKISN